MRHYLIATTLLLSALRMDAAAVSVRFDPAAPSVGPFPTDYLTVADTAQKTGKRISLPFPADCTKEFSTCLEIGYLNQLDGFNVAPRMSAQFSGAIQPDSIRNGMFLVPLENLAPREFSVNNETQVLPVNQVIYDPATNTAYAKPDPILDQHRRFLLVITNGVVDTTGAAVEADPAFTACITKPSNDYCTALAKAVQNVSAKFGAQRIVAASTFTTLSATAWMESARLALAASKPNARLTAPKSYIAMSDIATATFHAQVKTDGTFADTELPFSLLQGIRGMAFASFQSPNFLRSQQIEQLPTGNTVATPADSTEIFFHVMVPNTAKPAGGYPVVLFGHGITDNRFVGPSAMAPVLANAGFAVVMMNAVGHGYGPQSTFRVKQRDGATVEVPAPGRGVDMDGNGTIDASEGCLVAFPAPVALRDCLRQTALDCMQLVRVLQAGLDIDGDGKPDLDATRISYVGHSLGSMYGTLLMAVEPAIGSAALNVGGGTVIDLARWSTGMHSDLAPLLALRRPSLLNKGADFDDNYVLRYLPAKVNKVEGAIEIQNFFERLEWLQANGDPLHFAPHLWWATLPGVPMKNVLMLTAYGDKTVPTQTQTALVRAANLRENTWLYRNDYARAAVPALPDNPHIYMLNILTLPTAPVALATQTQVAGFLSSGGIAIEDPNSPTLRLLFGKNVFEAPSFLPEVPGY